MAELTRDENVLQRRGNRLARFQTEDYAQDVLRFVKKVPGSGAGPNDTDIESLIEGRFDVESARRRYDVFLRHTAGLRILGPVLMALVVVLVAMLPFAQVFAWWLAGAAVAALGLSIATGVLFYRAGRALYPVGRSRLLALAVGTAIYPFHAVRAADALSRPLFEPYDPIIAVSLFASEAQLRTIAGEQYRDLRHPIQPIFRSESQQATEIELSFRNRLLAALEKFAASRSISLDDLCGLPCAASPDSELICPRCLSRFTNVQASCPDCNGVILHPLQAREP